MTLQKQKKEAKHLILAVLMQLTSDGVSGETIQKIEDQIKGIIDDKIYVPYTRLHCSICGKPTSNFIPNEGTILAGAIILCTSCREKHHQAHAKINQLCKQITTAIREHFT